jgi:hypothetical protein
MATPKPASKVIVTTAAELKLPLLRAERLAPDGRRRLDYGELLHRLGDMRTGKAIVAMAPFALYRNQPAGKQFAKMGTGGLRGDARSIGQFTGRQGAPVQ